MTPTDAAEALLYRTTTKGGRYIKKGGLVVPYAGQQANPNRKLVPGENFRPELYLPKLVRDAVDQHRFYRDHATAHGRDDRRGPFFITSMPLAWGVYGFKNDAALSAIELCKTAAGWHDGPFEDGFDAMAAEMVRRGVSRGFIRPGHEASGPWYGCYYGIDPRLVQPGRVRDEFLRRADEILKGDHPDTFSPERFKQLVEGLAEDGDRAVPWKQAFRGMSGMIRAATSRHGLTEPGVLVCWNMAHGAAEPSGAGTPDADREFSRAIREDAFPGADVVDVMDLDFYGRGDGRSPEEAVKTLGEWGGLCRKVGVMRVAYSETWVQFQPASGPAANTASSDRQALEWFQTVWPHYAAQALGHGGFELEYVQVWASGRPERENLRFTYRPEVEDIPLTADYLIGNWYGPDPQGEAALIEPLDVWGEPGPDPDPVPDPEPEPDPEPPVVIDPEPEPQPEPGPEDPATPGEPIPGVELVTHYPAWDRNPEMRAVGHPNTGEPTIVTILALGPNTDRVGYRFAGGEWVQLTGEPVGQTIEIPSGSSIDVRGRRPGARHQWLNDWTTVHGV